MRAGIFLFCLFIPGIVLGTFEELNKGLRVWFIGRVLALYTYWFSSQHCKKKKKKKLNK
jgi:hypothetical protein